jgi:predicted dehydrogenase
LTRKLKVGVVGIGFGQQVIIPAFRADARCEVVALCAKTPERARRVADRLGVPRAHGDWREIVADSEIGAIAVAAPPLVQPAVVMAALARRKHVFCEKPLATSREAAAEMLAAARRSGMAHMVDFEFPEIEVWREAKRILDTGVLGRLRHGVVSWQVETYASRMGLKSWKTSPEEGGGTLNLFVSHIFYYLEWLLGPIERLTARLFALPGSRGEACGDTVAVLCVEGASGTPVSVSVSSNAFLGTGHRVELYGEEGSLILENPTSDYVSGFRLLHGVRETGRLEAVHGEYPASPEKDGRVIAVGRLVERFITWAQDGIPSTPTLEDGYRIQCLLDVARRAHTAGAWMGMSCTQV